MSNDQHLELPDRKRPRLRFWHIFLGGTGLALLAMLGIGLWHLVRVQQQVALVTQITQAGGGVSHYHRYVRLPDGEFKPKHEPSVLDGLRAKYPNACSQVIGIYGAKERVRDEKLSQEETERFFLAARGFRRLRIFELHSDFFTARHLEQLPSFRDLQLVRLIGNQISDSDISVLEEARDLRSLHLESSRLTDTAVPPIGKLAKLKRLTLNSPLVTDAGLARLVLPQDLESLTLNLSAVTDQGLCALPRLPQLKDLWLHMPVGEAGIIHLTQGGALVNLYAPEARFGDLGLAAIAKNQHLRGILDLSGCSVSDAGLQHLSAVPRLGAVDLEGTGVTDAGLAHLSASAGLRRLLLAKTKVTGVGMAHLRGLEILSEIDLSECPLTQEGLSSLRGLAQLSQLKLAGTGLTDDDCKLIPQFPRLRELDLSRTKLTDKSIPALMPTTISTICLDGTQLTDAGLLAIAEDEGDLDELSVRMTKITAKGVLGFYDRLQAREHSCKLIHDIPDAELNAILEAQQAAQAGINQPLDDDTKPGKCGD